MGNKAREKRSRIKQWARLLGFRPEAHIGVCVTKSKAHMRHEFCLQMSEWRVSPIYSMFEAIAIHGFHKAWAERDERHAVLLAGG